MHAPGIQPERPLNDGQCAGEGYFSYFEVNLSSMPSPPCVDHPLRVGDNLINSDLQYEKSKTHHHVALYDGTVYANLGSEA